MAEVIRLEQWLVKQPKRRREPSEEGRVLLFTGVRYERWSDVDDHTETRTTSSSKRKKH